MGENLYIPTVYLTKRGISMIASKIVRPLFADENTSNVSYLHFARICIDIKAGSDFSNSLKVTSKKGDRFNVQIVYEWIPRTCTYCSTFGHTIRQCPN